MIRIALPVSADEIRRLKVGDEVSLHGTIVTARDAGHKLMVETDAAFIRPYIQDGALYHCGPVMTRKEGAWIVAAAGPTTSIREEPYEAEVMARYGVRIIIGKGGMGRRTSDALMELGGAYLHAVGGAAVAIADTITGIDGVYMLDELGVPEAFWIMKVDGFKAIVTMDAHGKSLHDRVLRKSRAVRNALLR